MSDERKAVNMTTYSITLKVEQKPPFWLGDKLYKTEGHRGKFTTEDKVTLEANCPSCNNARKISYKGFDGTEYEASCPICNGGIGRERTNSIDLIDWEVHEYIVYKINAQGPTKLSAYTDGSGYVDIISLKAFCKIGRGINDYIEATVPWNNAIDPELSQLRIEDKSAHFLTDYVFHQKKDAERYCAMLKEYDRKRLEMFNKTYHVEHIYPF